MRGAKQRTLVFGGTFDPPHNGHISLVSEVLNRGYADQVVFVPALHPPHKTTEVNADFSDRAAMLKLAVGSAPDISGRSSVSEIEAERHESLSYTCDTMFELSERMPENELILLIGADSLMNLHTWREAETLVENWNVLAFPRGAAKRRNREILKTLQENWPDKTAKKLFVALLDIAPIDVSSSAIRKYLGEGAEHEARRHLPRKVFEYIKRKGLYGKS